MSAETEFVVARPEEGIVTVTITNDNTRNSLSSESWDVLSAELREIARNKADRAVIIKGAGGTFSSGGGMSPRRPAEPPRPPLDLMHKVNESCRLLFNLPKPTIAAVSGFAVGAGFNLALACDLSVAEESAVFSQIFIHRGLSPDFGGTWLLTQSIGLQRAKELVFFGEKLSAREVYERGLLNRVVPDGQAEPFALDWARQLAKRAPIALANAKSVMNAAASSTFEEALGREASAQQVNVSTTDTKDAIAAFMEKREPEFRGY